jgi:hypothetical protein
VSECVNDVIRLCRTAGRDPSFGSTRMSKAFSRGMFVPTPMIDCWVEVRRVRRGEILCDCFVRKPAGTKERVGVGGGDAPRPPARSLTSP